MTVARIVNLKIAWHPSHVDVLMSLYAKSVVTLQYIQYYYRRQIDLVAL